MKTRVSLCINIQSKSLKKQSNTLRIMPIKLPEYLYWGYCDFSEQCQQKKTVKKLYWDNLYRNYPKVDNTNIRTSKLFGDKPTKPPKSVLIEP